MFNSWFVFLLCVCEQRRDRTRALGEQVDVHSSSNSCDDRLEDLQATSVSNKRQSLRDKSETQARLADVPKDGQVKHTDVECCLHHRDVVEQLPLGLLSPWPQVCEDERHKV